VLGPQHRRRVLVLADQAASSLSNVVVAVLVARSFPDETEPFAAFSLAVMVYQFTVGSVRGLIFEPELTLHGDRDAVDAHAVMTSYIGATILAGVVVGAAIWGAGVVVGGMAGSALVALALVLPIVLVQDAWRYVFIVGRPSAALLIDLVWLASSCVAILLAPDGMSVSWYVLAWGAGGIAGAILATAVGRLRLAVSRPWAYIVENRELGFRFLGEFAASQAAFYLSLLSCGWILGLTAYGAVRGAFLFIGPLQMLAAAVIMSALPEARLMRDQPDRVLRLVRGAILLLGSATVAWTVVGLLLPSSVGEAIIGATWPDAHEVLLPLGITMLGMSIVACLLVGVRALDGTKGLRARMQTIPFQLACPVAGAFVGDLIGFVVGMAVGYAISAAIWWSTLERVRRSVRVPGSLSDAAVART